MMTRSRSRMLVTALVAALLSCGVDRLSAQQTETAPKPRNEEADKQPTAYRLDFTINELDDGKLVNSRQYSLNLNAGDTNSLKIGTRVPVEEKQGEFQYIDVGTSIQASLRERGNELTLGVRVDITNFATPDQQSRTSMPLLRQLQINGSTIVLPSKPMTVGVVDDPNSKRQFQLVVTVTKIR